MLGDHLRELRQEIGYSVRQMASKLSVSPGYVSRIEARGEIPSPELLLKIAELLKARPDALLRLAKESQLAHVEKQIDERQASALALFRKEKR
jgi:transcriptional regulator with XRE-family HTH domain